MDEAFEAWWKEMKPAEVDDLKNWFYECWQEAQAFERQQCAVLCDGEAEYADDRDNYNPRGQEMAERLADRIRARGAK